MMHSGWFCTLSRTCWLVLAVVGQVAVVKIYSQICCFIFQLFPVPSHFVPRRCPMTYIIKYIILFLWGQGEHCGGRLLFVYHDTPVIRSCCGRIYCSLHPLCCCAGMSFSASYHQVIAWSAALTPFGRSDTRSLMITKKCVGDSRHFCGVPCRMGSVWLFCCDDMCLSISAGLLQLHSPWVLLSAHPPRLCRTVVVGRCKMWEHHSVLGMLLRQLATCR